MSEGRSDFFAELAQNISYEASDQGENVHHYNTNDSDHFWSLFILFNEFAARKFQVETKGGMPRMSRMSDEWLRLRCISPVRRCSAFCASLCSATRILCTCKSYGAVFFLHQILHISSIHWYRWCWTIRCDTIKTKVYTVLDVFWFLDVYLLSVVACIMSVVDTDPQNSILQKAQITSSAQSPGHRISLQWHPSYWNLICHGNLLRTFVSEKASWIYYDILV